MTGLPPGLPSIDPLTFGLIQTSKKFGHLSAAGATGVTISSIATAEGAFDFVRVVYVNASTNSWTVTNAAVAATASIGDGYTPSSGNGSFVNLTFNNLGAFGPPPSPGGSASTVTVPACQNSGANTVYGMAASDWVALPSLERVDQLGSNIHLLLVRTYSAGTQYGLRAASQLLYNNWQSPSQNLGRPFRTFFKAGNCVTSPTSFTSPTESYNYGGTGMVVQFLSRTRGLSVVGVGDSLTQGHEYTANASVIATIAGTTTAGDVVSLTFANSATGFSAMVSYTLNGTDTLASTATALTAAINASLSLANAGITATSSTNTLNVTQPGNTANSTTITPGVSGAGTELISITNGGVMGGGAGSISMSDYYSWGHIACSSLSTTGCPVMWGNFGYGSQPHQYIYANAVNYVNNFNPDVLIFPASSPNDGTLTQAIVDAEWQRVVTLALLCQSKGIHFVVTTPVPLGTLTPLTYVQQIVNRVQGSGYSYLDWFNLLQNGSNPPSVKSIYNSGDGHPNDAGYTAMGSALQNLLTTFIARRPLL